MANDFEDFGQLYRAALAEGDPEKKSLLLKEVQRALEQWEQTTNSFMAAGAADRIKM